MLAAWLTSRYPEARVQEEESVKTAGNRASRRADVMATWQGGERLALEVEYKAFSPEAFNAKDGEYRQAGVRCVWLFGHLRRHLTQPRRAPGATADFVDDRLLLRNTTRAAAGAGHTLLFVNPVERSVATAVIEGRPLESRPPHWVEMPQHFGLRYPDGTEEPWQDIYLRIDSLDDCEADPHAGLVTPSMRDVEASRAEVERVLAIDRQRLEQQKEAARRVEQARQARERAQEARRQGTQRWLEERRAEQERTWLRSELRTRVLAAAGQVPPELAQPLRDSFGVFAHHEHWHCALYGDLVLAGGAGSFFTVGDCYRVLQGHGIEVNRKDPAKRAKAVIALLEHLELNGVLRIQYEPDSTWRISRIHVLATLEVAARAREMQRQTQEQADKARRIAIRRQMELKERRLQLLAEKNRLKYGTNQPAAPAPDLVACATCGGNLDPQLAHLGVHPCC